MTDAAPRRLLVVSATPHRRADDGTIAGWAATVRELDWVSRLFSEVVHVAPLEPGPPQPSDLPYAAPNIRLHAVRPAGGPGVLGKLDVVRHVPGWLRALRAEEPSADAIHIRGPANIALVATWRMLRSTKPCWIKYAGTWRPRHRDAVSYRLQRSLLRRSRPGLAVTVNGSWPDDPEHVVSFLNPSFSTAELERARRAAATKPEAPPWRLLFAGRLDEAKGCLRALDLVDALRRSGLDVELDVAGDGPLRRAITERAHAISATSAAMGDSTSKAPVRVHGWLAPEDLWALYSACHAVVLPSRSSEGWPKVLSEGMAHGAVPLASDISAIPQILARLHLGPALPARAPDAWLAGARELFTEPGRWAGHSGAALEAAGSFTYDRHVAAVKELLEDRCGLRTP